MTLLLERGGGCPGTVPGGAVPTGGMRLQMLQAVTAWWEAVCNAPGT